MIAMAACRTCTGTLEALAAHFKATQSETSERPALRRRLQSSSANPDRNSNGEFRTLHNWLKGNLYQLGRKCRPTELIDRLVGGLNVQPYLAYLRTKFGEIYRL